ncbi:MAG: hypothetical protein IKR25_01015 [Muribaculaceae bacterium]|nr:hypothetical protein [Muribaculaceae bacterium]
MTGKHHHEGHHTATCRYACWLIAAMLLCVCSCGGQSGHEEQPRSGIYLLGEFNDWQHHRDWEFASQGGGRYVLLDKDICLELAIDVRPSHRWDHAMWGGNSSDSLIMPNEPYCLGRQMGRCVPCGYHVLHCDSIVLHTQADSTATLTLHTSRPPQAFPTLTDSLAPAPSSQQPHPGGQQRILMLGNSLTSYNHQDSMLNAMAQRCGVDAVWTSHCRSGASLQDLWDEGPLLTRQGTVSARGLLAMQPWTHIVLQERSLQPLYNPEAFATAVHQWVEYIRQQPLCCHARIVLVQNWPRSMLWDEYTTVARAMAQTTATVAHREGIAVCPVGAAYLEQYRMGSQPLAKALYCDDLHPSVAGSYLAACLQFAIVTGTPPQAITWHPAALTDAEAKQLQNIAAHAFQRQESKTTEPRSWE